MNTVCYQKVKVAPEILRSNSSGLTSKSLLPASFIFFFEGESSSVKTFFFWPIFLKIVLFIVLLYTVYSLYCNVTVW